MLNVTGLAVAMYEVVRFAATPIGLHPLFTAGADSLPLVIVTK